MEYVSKIWHCPNLISELSWTELNYKRVLDFQIWKKIHKLYRLTTLKTKKLDVC